MKNIPDSITENSSMYHKRWQIIAPVGLLLVGFGLCVFGTALFKMRDHAPMLEWFLWGTGSLIAINAGLCFFGQAVKYSILYELGKEKGKQNNIQ